jgi:hypothetical protein
MDAEKLQEMITEVSAILMVYGYEVDTVNDTATITRFLNRNASYFNQQCNTIVVPTGLEPLLCDRTAADVLELKLNLNQLNIAGMDFSDKGVKSYSGGDVLITYGDSSTSTDRFSKIISSLRGSDAIFAQYRKIKW